MYKQSHIKRDQTHTPITSNLKNLIYILQNINDR